MNEAKQQLVDRLKTANNILVTVSRNPSVDQLSALLGLTLLLNKQGKHAAAVFSGEVPSTLEFLQPDETIEKNTDSLRDFIIALDKAKADKLRYKVEDDIVRIFITPYKTSISEKDFEFSQGDFNVDVVIGLGVSTQEDLDEAITAHGRILHDATVTSINASADGGLGAINWNEPTASSLSELVTTLASDLEGAVLDEQIATALMTGIVAETNRFSNDKTSAQTMTISATLMAAGANQQLVAAKLEPPKLAEDGETHELPKDDSDSGELAEPTDDESHGHGTLEIDHAEEIESEEAPEIDLPSPDENQAGQDEPESQDEPDNNESEVDGGSKLLTEPPLLGGTLTANSTEEKLDPVTDPLSMPKVEEPDLLDHNSEPLTVTPPAPDSPEPAAPQLTPPPAAWVPPAAPEPAALSEDNTQTSDSTPPSDTASLSDLEAAVQQATEEPTTPEPEAQATPQFDQPQPPAGLDDARDEVSRALSASSDMTAPQPPIQALNAQPIDLQPPAPEQPQPPVYEQPQPPVFENNQLPAQLDPSHLPSDPGPAPMAPVAPAQDAQFAPVQSDSPSQVADPNAPPPVPPPIPFQFGNPPSNQ